MVIIFLNVLSETNNFKTENALALDLGTLYCDLKKTARKLIFYYILFIYFLMKQF